MLKQEFLEKIKTLYDEGLNNTEIGKKINKKPASVSFYLKKLGLQNKIAQGWATKNIYKDKRYNEIVKRIMNDAQKGFTMKQSAKHLNINKDKVKEIASRENITFIKKGNAKYNCTGLENFLLRLQENNSKYEYVSGYVNDNSKVKLRCKDCGDVIERWASSVRQSKGFICYNCLKIAREQRQADKEKEKLEIIKMNKANRQLESIQLSFLVCKHCGKLFIPINNRTTFCSKRCADRNHEQKKSRQRIERAKQNGNVDYTITLDKLIKRDNNKCYLCNGECNLNDYTFVNNTKVAGNYYPSIDHVIPIVKGGTHTWDNIRLAHRICNSLKSDK